MITKIKSQKEARFKVTKATRFISIRLAVFLSRFNISPNQVTYISFGFGFAAFVSFSIGRSSFNILGMVLFLLSYLLDFVDGDLARLRNQTSQLGEWLDAVTGKIESVLLFLGICLGQAQHYSPALVWVLGFTSISGYYVSQSLMYKYTILSHKRKLNASGEAPGNKEHEAAKTRKESFPRRVIRELFIGGTFLVYAIIVCALLDKMILFLWIAAIYMWADNALQIYFRTRKIESLDSLREDKV